MEITVNVMNLRMVLNDIILIILPDTRGLRETYYPLTEEPSQGQSVEYIPEDKRKQELQNRYIPWNIL